ncbi:MAG: helix-turn-helix transcriptional regulator [Alteromonadaceae bacterium]|nr:helix-turn-helix transcriptional regulator [Alteromonadaceae bacterium]
MSSNNVGARLREVRGDMRQAEFAQLLGIGRTTLIRYESGERQLDADLILKLNVLFGVQPLWLLTGKQEARAGVELAPDELELIKHYRESSTKGKEALRATAKAFVQ